jgi:hypothetical protein
VAENINQKAFRLWAGRGGLLLLTNKRQTISTPECFENTAFLIFLIHTDDGEILLA